MTSSPPSLATETWPPSVPIPKELYRLRPMIWIADLVFDWAIIIAVFWAVASVNLWLIWPAGVLVIGSRQHALALLGHDAAHRVAFKSRLLNEALGNFFIAWPLFAVLDGYRPWHFEHHRRLGTDDDPELHYRARRPYSGPLSWTKVFHVFVLDLFGLGLFDLFVFMREIFPYRRPLTFLGPVLFWSIAAGLAFYFDVVWIILVWLVSLIAGFWTVFRVRTWTEHVAVPEPWNAGKENSHRFSANWLARFLFFPHNTHCHYEHHMYPQVPYYSLPALREHLTARPVVPVTRMFITFDL